MSRLQFYVLRQILTVLLIVAVGMFAIIWLTKSLTLIDLVMNRGLSWSMFAWITTLLLPASFTIVGPLALFSAVAFVYNKLSLDSELVIMRNAGVSHLGLSQPALAVAAMMVATGYLVSLYLMPVSYRIHRDLTFQITNNYSSVLIQEGVFSQIVPGVTVYVRERGLSGELIGILVHDTRKPDAPVTAMAERGLLMPGDIGPRMVMIRGNRQERRAEGVVSRLQFERYEFEFDTLTKTGFGRWKSPHEQFLGDLFDPPEAVGGKSRAQEFRMEGHERLAGPLMNFALPLVALALLLGAEFNRRGQLMRIIAAVVIVILLDASMIGAKSLGRRVPEVAPLIYIVPIAAILSCLFVLWRPRAWKGARGALGAVPVPSR